VNIEQFMTVGLLHPVYNRPLGAQEVYKMGVTGLATIETSPTILPVS
jgi:hypothetical protein